MPREVLNRDEKIRYLRQEFKKMDVNNDRKITLDEFIYQLDRKS